ncbi:hypothetical protein Tco_0615460 [Tanacetum coccineum]
MARSGTDLKMAKLCDTSASFWPYLAGGDDVELTAEKDWAFRRAARWPLLESLVVILFVVDSSILIVYYEVQGIENEAKTVYCAGGSWTNQRLPRGTSDVQVGGMSV